MSSLVDKYFGNQSDYIIDQKAELKLQRIPNGFNQIIFYMDPNSTIKNMKIVCPYPVLIECDVKVEGNTIAYPELKETELRTVVSFPFLLRKKTNTEMSKCEKIMLDHVSKNYIGGKLVGGYANQQFILAAAYALAKQKNCALCFPMKNFNPCQYRNVNEYFDTAFKFYDPPCNVTKYAKTISVGGPFEYKDLTKNAIPKTLIEGYFQNLKYFDFCKNDLRLLFSETQPTLEYIKEKYPLLFDPTLLKVFLHIRRGDYLIGSVHNTVNMTYYFNAIQQVRQKHVGKKIMYMLFSDDIPYCKTQFKDNVIYIENEKDYIEQYMMKYFDVAIVANSSFSYMGAYLGDIKEIYMPFKWMNIGGGNYPDGLINERCIKVSY